MDIVWHILFFMVLLLFSAFFSGTETAVFSLSRIQVKRIEEKNPKNSHILKSLLDNPTRTLNTILIGNTLVNVAASVVIANLFIMFFGERSVGISVFVMTFLVLIFGEVTPKIFAINNAERIVGYLIRPIHVISMIFLPLHIIFLKISDFFVAMIVRNVKKQPYMTEEELKTLISMGEEEGIIDQNEEYMINTVFELSERYVSEIMTPRVDVMAADMSFTKQELIDLMKQSRHKQIPVFNDNIDDLTGVIDAREYLLNPVDNWQSLIRPVLLIPKTKKIYDLLIEFRTKKLEIAVAVDEFGGTAGLVTLDDILEEIVGEIMDEYDDDQKEPIKKIGSRTFLIQGDTLLKDVEEIVGVIFETEEVETIGGFVMQVLGRIPLSGDNFKYKHCKLTVNKVSKNRVLSVIIKRAIFDIEREDAL